MEEVNILKAGHPLLKDRSEDITEFGSEALSELINRLFMTMRSHHGAGLAAPQIGISRRVIVYGIQNNPRYPDAEPIEETVLINPEIYFYSNVENEYYEGCLSLPQLRGLVPRANMIQYRARTVDGEHIDKTAFGFEARIIQHEVDHLEGILYPSRMQDMSTFKYLEA